MKKITIRCSYYTEQQLKNEQDSLTAAATKAVEAWAYLKAYESEGIKNIFTEAELTALVDRQNGLMLTPQFQASKNAVIAGIEDFETLENGISRHGADLFIILDKIKEMTPGQLYFLQQAIAEAWADGSVDSFINEYKIQ